jgi:hypothetical protein
MKTKLYLIRTVLCLLFSKSNYAQVPNLGAASSYALFTSVGAFTNTGTSGILGDVGTNAGAYTGSPTVVGQIHVEDSISNLVATDLNTAYTNMSSLTCTTVLGVTLGSNLNSKYLLYGCG